MVRSYAKRYQERRTSSGVIDNPKKLTAAHPKFPLGTWFIVINLAHNRSAVLVVNDRCRKYRTSFIDLY
jgi:rare lipoprotein A